MFKLVIQILAVGIGTGYHYIGQDIQGSIWITTSIILGFMPDRT